MGEIVVRAAMDAHIEMQILRLLRSIGGSTISISYDHGSGIVPDVLYIMAGANVPDLGECQVTVRESRSEGSDWISIAHEYTLEPRSKG